MPVGASCRRHIVDIYVSSRSLAISPFFPLMLSSVKCVELAVPPNCFFMVPMPTPSCVESALTYAVKYRTYAGKGRLVEPQLGIKIRHEHDRNVLPVATCIGQIGFLPWLWVPFNDLRVKGGRRYRLKNWIRRAKSQR
jgi:hypothetical protein